jgi:hypothetical protein
LEEEGEGEGEAVGGAEVAGLGEEEAAEQEEEDGRERFEPDVGGGYRLLGGAEGEDDGVSWIGLLEVAYI